MATGLRQLRLGVIQDGRFLEERMMRHGERVTVGASPECTIVVPDAGDAPTFALLEPGDGAWVLQFDETMSGRIALDGEAVDLAAWRGDVRARARGAREGCWTLPLGAAARGKVSVGDVTVLFQLVDAPAVAPRPVLPAGLRGGPFTDLDWAFLACVLVVTLVTAPSVWAMRRIPIPRDVSLEDVPRSVLKYITITPEWTKLPVVSDDAALEGDTAEAEADASATAAPDAAGPAPRTFTAEERARRAAERDARILGDARTRAGLVGLIGHEEAGGRGAVADVLKGGALSGNLDDAFSKIGIEHATTDTAGRIGARDGLEIGGPRRLADLAAGPIIGGVGTADAGTKGAERVPRPPVLERGPIKAPPTVDVDSIAEIVRRRMGAIRDCYEHELPRHPSLAGKVRLRFTITAAGRVEPGSMRVVENGLGDDKVPACMVDRISTWRFPETAIDGSGDGSGEVEFPFIFAGAPPGATR